VFSGRYEYALDEKGRVSIPARFREALALNYDMRLILTNLDGCIVAYPYKEWLNIQERISNLKEQNSHVRTFLRFFYSGVTECTIDRLGRIHIPLSLKNFAGIKKQVVIIGINKKIEIWAQEAWEEVVRQATSDPQKVQEIVVELGL